MKTTSTIEMIKCVRKELKTYPESVRLLRCLGELLKCAKSEAQYELKIRKQGQKYKKATQN